MCRAQHVAESEAYLDSFRKNLLVITSLSRRYRHQTAVVSSAPRWNAQCSGPGWKSARGDVNRTAREGFSASPVAFGGKVFFTNDRGETFVLRAGPDFELLHTNDIGARTLASPSLVDGRWFVRTQRELVAIGS